MTVPRSERHGHNNRARQIATGKHLWGSQRLRSNPAPRPAQARAAPKNRLTEDPYER